MSFLKYFIVLFALQFISCGQGRNSNQEYKESRELLPHPEGYQEDRFIPTGIDTVIFGNFCRENKTSSWNNKFRLIVTDSVRLFKDTSHYTPIDSTGNYNVSLKDKRLVDAAIELAKNISSSMLTDTAKMHQLYCPDCPHYCTLYCEIITDDGNRRWYYNFHQYQSKNLEAEKFRKKLSSTISFLVQETKP